MLPVEIIGGSCFCPNSRLVYSYGSNCSLTSAPTRHLAPLEDMELPLPTTPAIFLFGSPSTQTKRSFNLLVTGLESALDACPAMPGAALEASIESCLRRPSLDPSSSLRATRMFVRGLLSLVSTSQRSLCQSVVPVLVRFVSERECEASGEWCTSLSHRALARQAPC